MKNYFKKTGLTLALSASIASFGLGGCANLNTPTGQTQATQVAGQAVQYGLVAVQVADALVSAQAQITIVEKELNDKKSKFTPEQWAQLQATDKQINNFLTTIKQLEQMPSNSAAGNAATILINASQLYQMYGQVRAMYLTSRQIVATQYSNLTPIEQYNLQTLDNQAKTIDNAVTQLSASANAAGSNFQNITPIIIQALQVAALAAKVALAAGA